MRLAGLAETVQAKKGAVLMTAPIPSMRKSRSVEHATSTHGSAPAKKGSEAPTAPNKSVHPTAAETADATA